MIWPFRRRKRTLSDEHEEALQQLDDARNKREDVERLAGDLTQHGHDNHFGDRLFRDMERARRRPHDRPV